MTKFLSLILIVMAVVLPRPALAASFCVAGTGYPPQCVYDDIKVCMKAADPPNTSCTVNPQSLLRYFGGSRYCTVDSSMTAQCIYVDRAQCNQEAGVKNAACIDRIDMLDKTNPYRFDSRIQN